MLGDREEGLALLVPPEVSFIDESETTVRSDSHAIAQAIKGWLLLIGLATGQAAVRWGRTAPAKGTVLGFDVDLPADIGTGLLVWGLKRRGLELARGELLLKSETRRHLSFEVDIAETIHPSDDAITACLCLNNDAYRFYNPSVGDWFVRTEAVTDGARWRIQVDAAAWKRCERPSRETLVTVHYHRFDEQYQDVSLWTWDEPLIRTPTENELYPVGQDDFGVIFQVDSSGYGKQKDDRIGLLPRIRANWNLKDGPDRFWRSGESREVYLVQGWEKVYTSPPDVRPQITAACIDEDQIVTIWFTHAVPVAQVTPETVQVTDNDTNQNVPVRAVTPTDPQDGKSNAFQIEAAQNLQFVDHAYRVSTTDLGSAIARVGQVLRQSRRFFDPTVQMGAVYSPDRTIFRVFAPTALAVKVIVAEGINAPPMAEHEMTRRPSGIWEQTVEGDLDGKWYAFKLTGQGFDSDYEITDIYATCTQGRSPRSMIVNMAKTDPPAFRERTCKGVEAGTEAMIYELHVRDFTIAANSGVTHKGKYLGLAEGGTHLPDDPSIKTGIDHLVELGVTHVQIMPIQDFDNVEDESDGYHWGYMPVFFNSPDGWFATSIVGSQRISEFKTAVKAFHDRGIGVIMDVVYNHTSNRSSFEKLVPGYYFRTDAHGQLTNGSGCGNEFRSEAPMARKFLLDSLKYWLEEYQIDGFRFDLMGLIDLESMEQVKAELTALHPGILIYGEPWPGGASPLKPLTDKYQIRGTGISAFNDMFRDAVKGDRDGGPGGFIQGNDRADKLMLGLAGSINDWAVSPADSINYFEAHDNLTAWDKLLQSAPDEPEYIRERMMRLAALCLFTSQGMIFMHSGQEFCRSKQGNHNSYNAPDSINQIDWSLKKIHANVNDYHRGLIALRKAHPVFRLRTRGAVNARVVFPEPPNKRCVVYALDGIALAGESAEQILVLLNGGKRTTTFPLPMGKWTIYADPDKAGTEPLGTAEVEVKIPAHGGMVLIQ